ncbi:Rhodanese-related sulfurtransferase [Alkalithermobacter thermoalcaliphilus JW-YL-7 = DSM 7308]|uniref:Rhodanese-like protein n=1 Tax=Alkalithermobacter thermoalcaliphilus JW-YL-7 = DSM 7308 TaxID=1121328 RepID=A0A150FP16_CLOPD|nr:Rhodanese-like protein [[Clostridium] paradoxum JW-YL-7 = DSM 7308]SHK54234.1 Rhodanese-related sulfurtransferase [[Clostridium] paradoxum JW-YL-7 = DSM 7308]
MFNFNNKIENISVDQIEQELQNGAILIDIRNEDAYRQGHIKGAINIPMKLLPFKIQELDKDKTILVVCYIGGSSVVACKALSKAGFKVKNVVGGMKAFRGNLTVGN